MGSLPSPSFPPGVHVPSLTWFKDSPNQEIDWDIQEQHLKFLVSSSLHGIVVAGTNGEAVTLTAEEKSQLVKTARRIADDNGRPGLTITMGCGGQCTRDVIAETRLASDAGANFALVLVPSYFHFAMNESAIISFFEEAADESPIPMIIYNFPGVAAGLDLNTDMLITLGHHPRIMGVKLTCGGIAKVSRITATFPADEFCALAGQSDWLVPALTVGSVGVITGVGNVFPLVCVDIYDLYRRGRLEEAKAAQLKLAQAEWGFSKGGINGTKWVVAKILGYPLRSCHCRRPYPEFSDAKKQTWIANVCMPLQEPEALLSRRS